MWKSGSRSSNKFSTYTVTWKNLCYSPDCI